MDLLLFFIFRVDGSTFVPRRPGKTSLRGFYDPVGVIFFLPLFHYSSFSSVFLFSLFFTRYIIWAYGVCSRRVRRTDVFRVVKKGAKSGAGLRIYRAATGARVTNRWPTIEATAQKRFTILLLLLLCRVQQPSSWTVIKSLRPYLIIK